MPDDPTNIGAPIGHQPDRISDLHEAVGNAAWELDKAQGLIGLLIEKIEDAELREAFGAVRLLVEKIAGELGAQEERYIATPPKEFLRRAASAS